MGSGCSSYDDKIRELEDNLKDILHESREKYSDTRHALVAAQRDQQTALRELERLQYQFSDAKRTAKGFLDKLKGNKTAQFASMKSTITAYKLRIKTLETAQSAAATRAKHAANFVRDKRCGYEAAASAGQMNMHINMIVNQKAKDIVQNKQPHQTVYDFNPSVPSTEDEMTCAPTSITKSLEVSTTTVPTGQMPDANLHAQYMYNRDGSEDPEEENDTDYDYDDDDEDEDEEDNDDGNVFGPLPQSIVNHRRGNDTQISEEEESSSVRVVTAEEAERDREICRKEFLLREAEEMRADLISQALLIGPESGVLVARMVEEHLAARDANYSIPVCDRFLANVSVPPAVVTTTLPPLQIP